MGIDLPLSDTASVFWVLAAVVLFAPLLAERARLPGIIGLIVAGLVIGPNAIGLVDRAGTVEVLGAVGILYLMFLAGLDLDLDGFVERRRDSLVFAATTFAIPMTFGTGTGLALGFGWLGALLIGSALTSHTLISYPMVARLGLAKHPAVTATLGATLLVNTLALLVLGVVAAVQDGDPGMVFWLRLIASIGVFGVLIVYGVPRLTRRVFAGVGQDRTVRFTYVLVVLFGAASLARAAGLEPILGAFVAGLALNRYIVPGSVLMERVQFLGNAVLIPLFLVSTGMLIDPVALVSDPRTLRLAAAFSACVVTAKWLAAVVAAPLIGVGRAEGRIMFSLSVGQAAGTLAAVIIGAEVGLLGPQAVNASIAVILVTCVLAPIVALRAGPSVPRPERRARKLFEAVMVPIANPASARPLVEVAARLAASDNGTVLPVTVLGFDADPDRIDAQRDVTAAAERSALAMGADARSAVRVDASPTAGLLHAIREEGGTAMVIGWKGFANARENFFGSVIDAILAQSPVPVFVVRPGSDPDLGRVVVSVTRGDLTPGGRPGLEMAVQVGADMAKQAGVPLLVVAEDRDGDLDAVIAGHSRRYQVRVDDRKPQVALRGTTLPGDLVVVVTPPSGAGLGQSAPRVARAIPDRTLLAVVPRLGGE